MRIYTLLVVLVALLAAGNASLHADEPATTVVPSVAKRFAAAEVAEAPDFQKHIVPLLGKLGCNGRACHGSFQGRGGFRLSLFGYDFATDHAELYGRVDTETAAQSLILQKGLMEIQHEGGQRLKPGSWEHHLMQRWVQAGAPPRIQDPPTLVKLDVTPAEIQFIAAGQQQPLTAVAVWSNGVREDVTALCRFQTNDDQIADITAGGLVTAAEPGDTHVVAFYDSAVVPVPVIRPVTPQYGDQYPQVAAPTKIDELVVQKLRKIGVLQSDTCTDAEFLRRASLDVTGTLPTPAEIREFLADQSPDKRSRKIDQLLERPGYVAWWTTKICDITGNSDDKLNNVTPVQAEASKQWYEWVEKRVRENMPWDRIVEGIVLANSRNPGETYQQYCENVSKLYHKDGPGASGYAERQGLAHFWARQNFQSSEDRVIAFAYTFLGTRIQCAQCHKHPFDQWTQDDFKQFEGFFKATTGRQNARPDAKADYDKMLAELAGTTGLKGNAINIRDLRRVLAEQLAKGATVPLGEVYTTKVQARAAARNRPDAPPQRRGNGPAPSTAKVLAGPVVDLTQFEDARQPLMDWIRSPENPLFAKAFVNRIWASYFNVGIVQPADDLNQANPPVNAPLLDYLAKGFIEHQFDMKWLHREILNSRTYQLSWIPNSTNRQDERNFSRAVPRRLPAEIAWDIMMQASLSTEKNSEFVTALDKRALSIPGSGLRQRNRNPADYALTVFGRSIRESNCDCDRSNEPSLLQTIFVQNDGQVLSMLDAQDGWLAETCKQSGLQFTRKSSDNTAAAQQARTRTQLKARFKEQLKKLEDQLAAAEEKQSEKQIASLKNQIRTLRKQAVARGVIEADPQQDSQPDTADVAAAATTQLNTDTIITDAWLRTLSRMPTDSELQTAKTWISESKDPVEGIRGVLWALLNTREFIVNH